MFLVLYMTCSWYLMSERDLLLQRPNTSSSYVIVNSVPYRHEVRQKWEIILTHQEFQETNVIWETEWSSKYKRLSFNTVYVVRKVNHRHWD